MSVRCDSVARALARVVDGGDLDPLRQHHFDQCLTCQAELVRYKRLRRELRSLHSTLPSRPSRSLATVRPLFPEVDGQVAQRRSRSSRAAACLGGLAAAGAVMVASRRGRFAALS